MPGVWTHDYQMGLYKLICKHGFDLKSWCTLGVIPDNDYTLLGETFDAHEVVGVEERMNAMREILNPDTLPDESPIRPCYEPGDFELTSEGQTVLDQRQRNSSSALKAGQFTTLPYSIV